MCSCIASLFYKIEDGKNLQLNTVVLHKFDYITYMYIYYMYMYTFSALQSQICHNMESLVILKNVIYKSIFYASKAREVIRIEFKPKIALYKQEYISHLQIESFRS